MSQFDYTQLQGGEELVFGIATSSTSNSSTSTVNGVVIENNASASQTKIGVSNRRVIIESDGGATTIPNTDVRRVWIKRDDFMGKPRLELEAVETASGQRLDLKIGFLEAEDEGHIRGLFPGASIESPTPEKPKKKGIFAFLGFGA